MTKVSHPKSGYNQLWRGDAYDSLVTLKSLFKNPRIHTGKGYPNNRSLSPRMRPLWTAKEKESVGKGAWGEQMHGLYR